MQSLVRFRRSYLNIALACLATHELDAMTHKEWLLLFPFLEDKTGSLVFVLLHLPLFFAIFSWHSSPDQKVSNRFGKYISVFLLVHAFAHFGFSIFHSGYTFHPPIDLLTIYGAGFFSGLYLMTGKAETTSGL